MPGFAFLSFMYFTEWLIVLYIRKVDLQKQESLFFSCVARFLYGAYAHIQICDRL